MCILALATTAAHAALVGKTSDESEGDGVTGFGNRLRSVERATRPDPAFVDALRRRWNELPAGVRTPGQVLGRHGVGCEGTHGVFPRCNLACTPCYHSRDANRVRVDGGHTREHVTAQMRLLRQLRGPRAHAQLIGGEVSLLDPDDHAATLQAMRAAGREPMSFTHGDVDEEYLERLVLGPDGRRRLRRVSFAAHFDMFMYGRRGLPRPPDEASLDPYRQQFATRVKSLRTTRRSFVSGAQHDGDAGQSRPGRRRRPVGRWHGLRPAVVPAGRVRGRRPAMAGRLRPDHWRCGVGGDRTRCGHSPGLPDLRARRRAVQPDRVRLPGGRAVVPAAGRRRPSRYRRAGTASSPISAPSASPEPRRLSSPRNCCESPPGIRS